MFSIDQLRRRVAYDEAGQWWSACARWGVSHRDWKGRRNGRDLRPCRPRQVASRYRFGLPAGR